MDQERINLGLAGPGTPDKQAGGAPFSIPIGDVTVGAAAVPLWRFRAPSAMIAYNISIFCAGINDTMSRGTLMVEAYLNGKYVAEIPISGKGVEIDVPVALRKHDLVELKLSARGGINADTRVTDVWILYCARI